MKRLRILTLISVIASIMIFIKSKKQTTILEGDGLVIKKEWLVTNPTPLTPKEDVRAADQTFLTFPEWYLVFSPEEQAEYYKHTTSSSFPFMSHVKQLWESYSVVKAQIKNNFPPNKGYHFMIWVIATSTTVEYTFKSLYENTIGRLTDTKQVITDEDKFNARFAQDYVDFIKIQPWYEFDFKTQLKKLWTQSSFFGPYFFRKIERKYLLTCELSIKWLYAKLIGIGTKQVYEEALPTTSVVTNKNEILKLPRYDKFSNAIMEQAVKGESFKEIAGNNSAILLSIIVDDNYLFTFENVQLLFTQPIMSNKLKKRMAIVVTVNHLHELLLQLSEDHINLEHVFDY